MYTQLFAAAAYAKGGSGSASASLEAKEIKKDEFLKARRERVPFLDEQLRTMDIEKLLLREENRFDFVDEVAAEATAYVESNRDESGGTKKAILHVLSNQVNDAGFYRPNAYAESDPFKPGLDYLKKEFT